MLLRRTSTPATLGRNFRRAHSHQRAEGGAIEKSTIFSQRERLCVVAARHHRATAVTLMQKSVFNLGIDTMKPRLGKLGSFLVGGYFRFRLLYPIFSRTKLMR